VIIHLVHEAFRQPERLILENTAVRIRESQRAPGVNEVWAVLGALSEHFLDSKGEWECAAGHGGLADLIPKLRGLTAEIQLAEEFILDIRKLRRPAV
jgi:hypothetical protein